MTTNSNSAPEALSVKHTNEEIRRRHAEQSDLHRLTAKTRAQYEKGLLTLEDLMMELIAIRNSYFDDPERGTWILDCIRD